MDLLEPLNRRTIELADPSLELLRSEGGRGNRDVLERAEDVHELQIDPTNPLGLNLLHHRSHGRLLRLRRCTRRNRHVLPAGTDATNRPEFRQKSAHI
jgi:hypothetical protein